MFLEGFASLGIAKVISFHAVHLRHCSLDRGQDNTITHFGFNFCKKTMQHVKLLLTMVLLVLSYRQNKNAYLILVTVTQDSGDLVTTLVELDWVWGVLHKY